MFAGRPEQQVAGAQGQAAAVREQVAHAHFARDVGVGHAEAGQMVDDPVVEAKLSVVGQDRQRRRGERLGLRGDGETCLRVHGRARALVAFAEAAGHHDLAVLDDGDGDAGHVEGFARAFDDLVQGGWRRQGDGREQTEGEGGLAQAGGSFQGCRPIMPKRLSPGAAGRTRVLRRRFPPPPGPAARRGTSARRRPAGDGR